MLPTQQDRRWVENRVAAFQPLPMVYRAPIGIILLPQLVHHIQWQTTKECWPATKEELTALETPAAMQKYLEIVAASIGAG